MKRRKFFKIAGYTLTGAVITPQLFAEDKIIALPSRLHEADEVGVIITDVEMMINAQREMISAITGIPKRILIDNLKLK
jgi:hypothetical protein